MENIHCVFQYIYPLYTQQTNSIYTCSSIWLLNTNVRPPSVSHLCEFSWKTTHSLIKRLFNVTCFDHWVAQSGAHGPKLGHRKVWFGPPDV